MASTLDEARAAKSEALKVFSALGTVVGVGITRVGDGYGVKVNLQAQPGPSVKLPEKVEGVPVRVEVVGILRRD